MVRLAKRQPAFGTLRASTAGRPDSSPPPLTHLGRQLPKWASTGLNSYDLNVSTLDDICWKWSKRASSTSIVASLYRLAVVPFYLVQQWDRNVA